jgi:hypothetical protein
VGVVVAGVAISVRTSEAAYVVWSVFVLLVLGWIASRVSTRARGDRASPVAFEEDCIRCGSDRIRWDELVRIRIRTTNEGPFFEDLFWVFETAANSCMVPGQLVTSALFDRLGKLEGVDFSAVIEAQGSTDNGEFQVWARPIEPSERNRGVG